VKNKKSGTGEEVKCLVGSGRNRREGDTRRKKKKKGPKRKKTIRGGRVVMQPTPPTLRRKTGRRKSSQFNQLSDHQKQPEINRGTLKCPVFTPSHERKEKKPWVYIGKAVPVGGRSRRPWKDKTRKKTGGGQKGGKSLGTFSGGLYGNRYCLSRSKQVDKPGPKLVSRTKIPTSIGNQWGGAL